MASPFCTPREAFFSDFEDFEEGDEGAKGSVMHADSAIDIHRKDKTMEACGDCCKWTSVLEALRIRLEANAVLCVEAFTNERGHQQQLIREIENLNALCKEAQGKEVALSEALQRITELKLEGTAREEDSIYIHTKLEQCENEKNELNSKLEKIQETLCTNTLALQDLKNEKERVSEEYETKLNEAAHNLQELQDEKKKACESLKSVMALFKECKKQMAIAEDESKQKDKVLETHKQSISELQAKNKELNEELITSKHARKTDEKEIKTLKKNLMQFEKDYAKLKVDSDGIITNLKKELKQAANVHDEDKEKYERCINEEKKQSAMVIQNLKDLYQGTIEKHQELVSNQKLELNQLEAKLANMQSMNALLEASGNDHKKEIENLLKAAITSKNELLEKEAKINNLVETVETVKLDLNDKKLQIDYLLVSAEEKNDELRKEREKLEAHVMSTQKLNDSILLLETEAKLSESLILETRNQQKKAEQDLIIQETLISNQESKIESLSLLAIEETKKNKDIHDNLNETIKRLETMNLMLISDLKYANSHVKILDPIVKVLENTASLLVSEKINLETRLCIIIPTLSEESDLLQKVEKIECHIKYLERTIAELNHQEIIHKTQANVTEMQLANLKQEHELLESKMKSLGALLGCDSATLSSEGFALVKETFYSLLHGWHSSLLKVSPLEINAEIISISSHTALVDAIYDKYDLMAQSNVGYTLDLGFIPEEKDFFIHTVASLVRQLNNILRNINFTTVPTNTSEQSGALISNDSDESMKIAMLTQRIIETHAANFVQENHNLKLKARSLTSMIKSLRKEFRNMEELFSDLKADYVTKGQIYETTFNENQALKESIQSRDLCVSSLVEKTKSVKMGYSEQLKRSAALIHSLQAKLDNALSERVDAITNLNILIQENAVQDELIKTLKLKLANA